MLWLVVHYNDYQEVVEAADFDELYDKVYSDDIVAVIRMNKNVYAESK